MRKRNDHHKTKNHESELYISHMKKFYVYIYAKHCTHS